MNNQIDLFCGLNSIGMPYTKDNKDHIGYFHIVESYLKAQGFDVNGINMSRLNRNNTWDLERIFNKSYSLSKIKKFQLRSIDALRNTNFLFKLIVPEKFKSTITINHNDENIKIIDVYKNSQNPIFLYSTGSNDFLTYIGAGPVEMMNSDIRKQMYPKMAEAYSKTISNVDKNFKLLTELNANVEIYAIGTFYAPIFKSISKIISLENRIKHIETDYEDILAYSVEYYNNHVRKLCDNYKNIHYIDVSYLTNYCASFDFHPNSKGNELLGKQIIEQIEIDSIIKGDRIK